MNNKFQFGKGFSLIELLVVISIIGILAAMSIFGLNGARQSSRDARRKADLEQVRSGLEIYKADCNIYPTTAQLDLSTAGSLTAACPGPAVNTYLVKPLDPTAPTSNYLYSSAGASSYELCAYMENETGTVTCGGSSACGTTKTCNYKVIQP
jgi:prepilin-type N-terminal cleavage/methylation domain-containing protein